MEDYEKLLDEAYKNTKQIDVSGERFEIPKIEGHFQGKRTRSSDGFRGLAWSQFY